MILDAASFYFGLSGLDFQKAGINTFEKLITFKALHTKLVADSEGSEKVISGFLL